VAARPLLLLLLLLLSAEGPLSRGTLGLGVAEFSVFVMELASHLLTDWTPTIVLCLETLATLTLNGDLDEPTMVLVASDLVPLFFAVGDLFFFCLFMHSVLGNQTPLLQPMLTSLSVACVTMWLEVFGKLSEGPRFPLATKLGLLLF